MKSLNAENFFNGLEKKFPDAVKFWWKWWAQYKAENNWEALFNCFPEDHIIDFFDIPLEFQHGIMMRFEMELFNNGLGQGRQHYQKTMAVQFPPRVFALFGELQKNFNNQKTKMN